MYMDEMFHTNVKNNLHYLVWENRFYDLAKEIKETYHDINLPDPRGRTPLMLAVSLGHCECAHILLKHKAAVNIEKNGFSAIQEAVCTGDTNLVQELMDRNDSERYNRRKLMIPNLLYTLNTTPDFYVEMRWTFSSIVSSVNKICPSVSYKIYKSGRFLRIDTTLLHFDEVGWKIGDRSYVFKDQKEDGIILMEIDHQANQIVMDQVDENLTKGCGTSTGSLASYFKGPVTTSFIYTNRNHYKGDRSLLWKLSDKNETLNGYDCQVYTSHKGLLVTKLSPENLFPATKEKYSIYSPIHSLLGIEEIAEISKTDGAMNTVFPIVEFLGQNSLHFAKLTQFLKNKIPYGFPVKMEIPICQLINADISFQNIFAGEQPVPGVLAFSEESDAHGSFNSGSSCRLSGYGGLADAPIATTLDPSPICVVQDDCFNMPSGYCIKLDTEPLYNLGIEEDANLVESAMQVLLMEAGLKELEKIRDRHQRNLGSFQIQESSQLNVGSSMHLLDRNAEAVETDQITIARRQTQVACIKCSWRYLRYVAMTTKDIRPAGCPKTPDIKKKRPRTAWLAEVRQWNDELIAWEKTITDVANRTDKEAVCDNIQG